VVGLLGILILLFMMIALRIPVAFSMAMVGFGGIWYKLSFEAAATVISTETWAQFSSYGMTVLIPFILMGTICFQAEVNKSLYGTFHTWFGRTRGGMAIATVLGCAGFSAISGSNAATAATMTTVALPEMEKYHYNKALSTGSIACGSTLGVVIPPSLVLLVYGLQTGVSIGKLFWAALLPGLLLTSLLCITIYVLCVIHKDWGPSGAKTGFLEKLKAIPGAIEMIILFVLVMGGLATGAYTPTEAGSAGAFFALLIAFAIRRKLTTKRFFAAVQDTLKISTMVMMIVLGAVIFGRFMTISRLPFVLLDLIASFNIPDYLVMFFVFAIFVLAGAIMDAMGFLLISIPIFVPIANSMGYDPIWFGVTITIITTLGAITPPVGICTFVVASMSEGIPLSTVFKGVVWFIPAYFITIIALMVFPQLALFILKFVS
jgi:tripartite ATP-independent transporter DctM subunit